MRFILIMCFLSISETAMGAKVYAQISSESEYVKAVKE